MAWFAAVLGAAHHLPWLSLVFVPLAFVLHLALAPDRRAEMLLALAAGGAGFVFDTVLISAGVYSPRPFLFPPPLSPLWMVLLWINFATALNTSLSFLKGRYFLSAVFGAIGGPMAYYGGARLGAFAEIPGPLSLGILAIAWAVAVPFLVFLASTIPGQLRR